MANMNEVFSDGRNRLIIFLAVIFVAGVFSYIGYRGYSTLTPAGNESVQTPMAPKSVGKETGGDFANPEAAKLAMEQDRANAMKAEKQGDSVVPIIVGKNFTSPGAMNTQQPDSNQNCSPEKVKRAYESGVTAFEMKCQGCSAAELKAGGYSAGALSRSRWIQCCCAQSSRFFGQRIKRCGL